jgi:hypothetical protein
LGSLFRFAPTLLDFLGRAHREGHSPGAVGLRIPRSRRPVLGRANLGRHPSALPRGRSNALSLKATGRSPVCSEGLSAWQRCLQRRLGVSPSTRQTLRATALAGAAIPGLGWTWRHAKRKRCNQSVIISLSACLAAKKYETWIWSIRQVPADLVTRLRVSSLLVRFS